MRHIPALFLLVAAFPWPSRADTWLVMPLANQTNKPNLDWIGESVGESISEALLRQGLLVVDRAARQEGENRLALRSNSLLTLASMLKLAETLDADHLVYGEIQLKPVASGMGTLQLKVEMVNVRHLRPGGRFTETGPLEDLASLQSHLAWQVLSKTLPKSAPTEVQFRQARTNIRVDAVENYVRGLLASTPETREKFFQQALRLDSRYSQAAFQYGRLLFERDNLPSAVLQLDKVQIWDPHYREAQFLLGLGRFQLNEFRLAAVAFDKVRQEVPLNEVLNNLGLAQLRLGLPEAVETLRRALEGDPNDATYHYNLGLALLMRGAYSEAATQFRASLDRNPEDPEATRLLGRCLRVTAIPPGRDEFAGAERLKYEYEEAAYLQLKAIIAPKNN